MGLVRSVRSVLYCMLLFCCAMALAVQCWHLVVQFLEEPVAIDMDTVSGVSEAPFPDVTVCDSNQFSRRVARAWGVLNDKGRGIKWNRFPWASRSVTQFWQEAAPKLSDIVAQCNAYDCRAKGPRGGNTSLGVWTPGWYRRGICYTFHPHGIVVKKRERYLQLQTHSDPDDDTVSGAVPSVQIFFHGRETPVVDNDFDDAEPAAYLTMQAGEVSQLVVSARQRWLQPLRRRPCNTSVGYSRPRCLVLCRWSEWAHAIGCRPPWSDATTLPFCSTKDDFLQMKDKRFSHASPEDDPCLSRCLPACFTTVYQLQVTKLEVVEYLKLKNMASVKVIWPYVADRTRERLSYSGSDLISDLGGSLGLLLGLSVLSAVQLVEDAVRSMMSICRRRRVTHLADIVEA